MVVVYGAQASFGVFFKPMLNQFGWNRAETSGPFALYMVVSGVLSFVSGRLADRFGPRKVVAVGGLILGVGYLLTSQIQNLWQLYLCYGVLVAAGSSAMYVPPVAMLAKWFTKRRGLMSGVGISGIGFGIGVVPTAATQLIVSYDWRVALLVVGSVSLVLLLILAQLLRASPEAADATANKRQKDAAQNTLKGFSFREAVKSRPFWMIFIAWLFYGFFFQLGVVHIVPYATDLGMTAVAAATVLTVIGIVGIFGRVSLGLVGDKFGNKKTVFISFGVMAVGFLGLSLSGTIWMLYLFAVIFGALSGIGILVVPTLADYFGFKELGTISGAVVFANCLGGAISPPLAGAIFDSTGKYLAAFIICAVLGLGAAVIIRLLKPPA